MSLEPAACSGYEKGVGKRHDLDVEETMIYSCALLAESEDGEQQQGHPLMPYKFSSKLRLACSHQTEALERRFETSPFGNKFYLFSKM